jgi:anoctamin-10/anoctamin-7
MVGIVQEEHQRPEFEGVLQKDPVTGKIKKISTMTNKMRRCKKFFSCSILFFFVTLVLAIVLSIFLYRATLHDEWGPRFCAFLNAIQIKVMNTIYRVVARKLTDWENHETDSLYNDSLAIKLFLFQFVNSYNSLFYIAFLKSSLEGCIDGDCMHELTI